ncbi:MAG: LysM peptidoglycan-binding domain-containing protein [Desulfuromonadales bacterium]|nr:MAG: LysM peptidoglycan-binding domain-containing protein [Desulfuromonadales bacterium]
MTYTVKPGDTLSEIAAKHGTSLDQLLAANPVYRKNPNSLGVGAVLRIPVAAQPSTPDDADGSLGKLSEKYETDGRGAGTVSSGVGDPGGVSYGCYQMTSKPGGGTVKSFVSQANFAWKAAFAVLVPGSADFTAKWKKLATAEPDAFRAAQHAYIKRTHFDVLVATIRERDNLDITGRSRALKDAVWSTSVQHGPNSSVVHNALRALGAWNADDPDFDRRLIHAIYAERGRKKDNGDLVYFGACSPSVQKGVAARFASEEKDALAMLAGG